jgi:hypothetical protein
MQVTAAALQNKKRSAATLAFKSKREFTSVLVQTQSGKKVTCIEYN